MKFNCQSCFLLLTLILTLLRSSKSNEYRDFRPTPELPTEMPEDNNFQSVLDSTSRGLYQPLYGGFFPPPTVPPRYQGSVLIRAYCQNHRVIRINRINGYANLYCVKDSNFLRNVMFYNLPEEGLKGDTTTGWYAADMVFQAFGYVPVCASHCTQGTRLTLPPGNYTSPMYSSYYAVGCEDVFTSTCSAVCPDDVYEAENGKVSCTQDTQVGSVCTVQCREGHVAVGPVSKTCHAIKRWDDTQPFKCLTRDVGNAVKHLMRNRGLPVEVALAELRTMLERYLNERNQASPSTRRESAANSMEPLAEAQITKFIEQILVKLSKSTPITLKRLSTCAISPKERHDCGWQGVTERQCQSRGCCFDSSKDNTIWCFYKNSGIRPITLTTKTTTKYPHSFNTAASYNQLNHQGRFRPVPTYENIFPTSNLQPQHDFQNRFPFTPISIQNPGKTEPKEEQCGCVHRQVSRCVLTPMTRVFCGQRTRAEKWPWHAIVDHGNTMCGGTLIAKNYVLTAAHCLKLTDGVSDSDSGNKVYLGVSNRDEPDAALQIRGMKRIIRHPLFYSRGSDHAQNDIALIQLSEPAKFSNSVRTLCMPGKSRPSLNNNCYITGFGKKTASEENGSSTLQSAPIPIITTDLCSRIYGKFNVAQNLCAGTLRPDSADACKGDSGGPLACQSTEGDGCSWYLAGVTSYGNEPCGGGSPGVYVNVAHYEDWIHSHIRPFQGR